MKTTLEQEDIRAIANTVVEMIKPLLKSSTKYGKDETIFDVEGLSQYLKVGRSWIYQQTSLKNIPYFKVGKYPRFKKSEIDTWINKKSIMPIPPLKIAKNSR